MEKKSYLELYDYIDEEGLDSLYAQCGQFLVESLIKMEKAGEFDADAEVEMGKLLSILGIGSAKIEGKFSLNRLQSESVKTIFRVEQRIPLILDYLKKEGNLRELLSYSSMIHCSQANPVGVNDGYILMECEWQPPDFLEIIKKSKDIDITQIISAITFRDKEELKPRGFVSFISQTALGRITMGTSLAKYRIGLNHLILMWRPSEGDKVKLRVFGYLKRTSENEYYLKPFTIAQATWK